MNEREFYKDKILKIFMELDRHGKEEEKQAIIDIIQRVKEHILMHPLGRPVSIEKEEILISTESVYKSIFYVEPKDPKSKDDYYKKVCYDSKSEKGKKTWESGDGYVYNIEMESSKIAPEKIAESIMSEPQLSTLFRPVSVKDDRLLSLNTTHVLTHNNFATALAVCLCRAAEAYGVKVRLIKRIKFEDQ